MGFFKSIGDAIYREYDRRIKRASLVTEYGAHHHGHAHAGEVPHADATNEDVAAAGHDEEAEEAEIANVPRGTPVVKQPASEPAEAQH